MGIVEEEKIGLDITNPEMVSGKISPPARGGGLKDITPLSPRQREILMGHHTLTREEIERPVLPGRQRHVNNATAIRLTQRNYEG